MALAGYIGIVALAALALEGLDASPGWYGLLVLGLSAIVAFEAHALKATKLDADGWTLLGSVSGSGLRECERRFFEHWLPSQPALRQGLEPAAPLQPATPTAAGVTSRGLYVGQGAHGAAQIVARAKSLFSVMRRKG